MTKRAPSERSNGTGRPIIKPEHIAPHGLSSELFRQANRTMHAYRQPSRTVPIARTIGDVSNTTISHRNGGKQSSAAGQRAR